MIIDSHTHVWPDAIAEKAMGGRDHGLETFGNGKISGLIDDMERSGIDRSVIFGIGEKAETLDRANEFVGKQDRDHFIPFGSVHVDLSPDENLEILRRHDIRGVKVHPLFQGFALNDPRLIEIFSAIGSELPVLAHVGKGGTPDANARCTPEMVIEIIEAVPDLDFIAAHFGGYRQLDAADRLLTGLPIYFETSWPPHTSDLEVDRVRSIVSRHGADRVIFGSDWPMADPSEEIAAVRAWDLEPDEEAAVLGGNLARLVGLE